MKRFKSCAPAESREVSALRRSLAEAQRDLAWAYNRFDQAVDPELVESCCYEISAAKSRCDFLLRQIKQLSEEESQWT